MRDSLSLLIRSVGLKVLAFAHPQEFLDQYDPSHVGCIVLDIRMPGISGFSVHDLVRAGEHALPVIFITGHGDVAQCRRAFQHGASDFLTKPVDEQLLLESLQKAGDRGRRIAADNDSQFVISGGVVDASSFTAGGMFGLFEHAVRRFELEPFVHDGMTGAMIARHRVLETAAGDVRIGGGHSFGSAAFTASSYGQAIARALASAANLIAADLEHLPFMAKIIDVSGKRVYIDAGGTSLLAPGDQLVVFHRGPALYGDGAASCGPAETPVATLSITEVQPTFAAAEVDPSAVAPAIASGDLVRFEFASGRQAVQAEVPQLY